MSSLLQIELSFVRLLEQILSTMVDFQVTNKSAFAHTVDPENDFKLTSSLLDITRMLIQRRLNILRLQPRTHRKLRLGLVAHAVCVLDVHRRRIEELTPRVKRPYGVFGRWIPW